MNCRLLLHVLLAFACTQAFATEPVRVEVESLDRAGDQAIRLPGFWFRNEAAGVAPAILLLHGCGGPYGRTGQLSARMREYAALFNADGFNVLITDSLTPRGERELCTQKSRTRRVTMLNRRRDVFGALQWLAQQPEVDARRLALLGWSNGGSTVLAATNLAHPEVRSSPHQPALAAVFYPGCKDELRRGYRPVAPLLMLLGGSDDWTPPEPCQTMAETSAAPKPEVVLHPGVYHGFDGNGPLTLRLDVPNGVKPGKGVHVGGDATARASSRERLLRFLRQMNPSNQAESAALPSVF